MFFNFDQCKILGVFFGKGLSVRVLRTPSGSGVGLGVKILGKIFHQWLKDFLGVSWQGIIDL